MTSPKNEKPAAAEKPAAEKPTSAAKTRTPAEKVEKTVTAIRVTSKRDGFRRAGQDWTGVTCIEKEAISAAQLEQLKNEPMLVVDECEVDPADIKTL